MRAIDRSTKDIVAIKIVRAVRKYQKAAAIQLRVLSMLKANDPENRNRCIRLRDCFNYRGHICIVMELAGQSVDAFLRHNNFIPFPISHIRSFARQMLGSTACRYSGVLGFVSHSSQFSTT